MSDLKPFPYMTLTPAQIAEMESRRRSSAPLNVKNFEYLESVHRFVRDEFPVGSKVSLLGEEAMVVEHVTHMVGSKYDSATLMHKSAAGGLAKTTLEVSALAGLKGYEAPVPPWMRSDYEPPTQPDPPTPPAPATRTPSFWEWLYFRRKL